MAGRSFATRLPLEIIQVARQTWPEERSLLMRMSATDHLADSVGLLDISAGNIVPGHAAAVYPAYQLKYGEYLKGEVEILTASTGSLASADLLEEALGAQRSDLAFVGLCYATRCGS